MNRQEIALNIAGAQLLLPPLKDGRTAFGNHPATGGHADFSYAGARRSWTAPRLLLGVATCGFSLLAGRKEKGSAMLTVTYGDGAVKTRRIRAKELQAGQRYASLFTAYAGALEAASPLPGLVGRERVTEETDSVAASLAPAQHSNDGGRTWHEYAGDASSHVAQCAWRHWPPGDDHQKLVRAPYGADTTLGMNSEVDYTCGHCGGFVRWIEGAWVHTLMPQDPSQWRRSEAAH